MLEKKEDYIFLSKELIKLHDEERNQLLRHFCKNDLFFLCFIILNQKFYYHDFAFDLCKKIEKNPFQLWLVARGHLKSLTITIAHNIQLLLNNPETTIAIISYNLKIAKSFIRQIKNVFETNEILQNLFPEILFKNPAKESPKWSEQEGLILRRKSNQKEPNIVGFGLMDSQAVGHHYNILSYDDIVVPESVGTPEMIEKTNERWQLSDNLSMPLVLKKYCGTRYHYFDTYELIKKNTPTVIIPALDNGELDGRPVFFTEEEILKKKKEQGNYIFSSQMLLKPVAAADQKFKMEDIKYYDVLPNTFNYYIAVDPANTKNKKSDYTAIIVFGFSTERKIYIVDAVHDKLSLDERYLALKTLNDKYRPIRIGYEQYGLQTDLSYFNLENERQKYYMPLFKMGGLLAKKDRILRLTALFNNGGLLFPKNLLYFSKHENKQIDIVNRLLLELMAFPFAEHDDLSDCLSRCFDVFLNKPEEPKVKITEEITKTAGYEFLQKLKINKGKYD